MKKAILFAIALCLSFVVAAPISAGAQTDNPQKILTLTPTTAKPVVDPGGSTRGTFQVINQGSVEYQTRIYAAPYSVDGEAYSPDFTPSAGAPDVASWLQFTPTESLVKPGQTLDVQYTLTVPAGTQPGGYYAVAFAETKAPKNGQGVVVTQRVGEIFYIQVAGPVKEAGSLLTWSSAALQKQPLTAELRVENSGSLHFTSAVQVVVRDVFGNPKYTFKTEKAVLPHTIRRIPVTWENTPAFGLFKVTGSVTIAGKSQALSTKYVLVASPLVRYIGLGIILAAIAFVAGRIVVRRKKQPTNQAPPTKP